LVEKRRSLKFFNPEEPEAKSAITDDTAQRSRTPSFSILRLRGFTPMKNLRAFANSANENFAKKHPVAGLHYRLARTSSARNPCNPWFISLTL
jgi:hypothetical protein